MVQRKSPRRRRQDDAETRADLEVERSRPDDFDGAAAHGNLFPVDLQGIDDIALGVPDVAKAIAWYGDVLGFERRHAEVWGDVPAFVVKGATGLAFFLEEEARAGRKSGGGAMLHLAFRADRAGFVRAQEELKERGIKFSFADHEISHSIYFRDLNGLRLEITTYEV